MLPKIALFIFDFVHILKSVRNNWLNQNDFPRTSHFPNFQNFHLSSCEDHIQVLSASFSDVRLLYNSEKQSLAKLAPRLTIKACFPSIIQRQNVKLVLKVVNELTIAAMKYKMNLATQRAETILMNLLISSLKYGKYSILVLHLKVNV